MRVRTQARRESILNTATQVFMEFGYERASMTEIAQRSGGSKATLYGYFRSKEALFQAVVQYQVGRPIEQVLQLLPSQADADPFNVLLHLGETFLGAILTPQAIALRPLLLAQLAVHSELARNMWEQGPQRLLSGLEAYLQQANQSGRLQLDNAGIAARQMLALYQAEMDGPERFGLVQCPGPEHIQAMVTRAVRLFLAAYRP